MTCKEKIISDQYIGLLTNLRSVGLFDPLEGREDGIGPLEGIDYCYQHVDGEFGILYVNLEDIGTLSLSNVVYRYFPAAFGLMQLETAVSGEPFDPQPLIASGITQVQGPPLSLTGQGVILAFLDTGIDYQNPVFQYSDGSSRILSIWDQTIQEGPSPEGIFYGTEYTRAQINEALASGNPYQVVPSRDENGHGTIVASAAAGSRILEGAAFTGAAPDVNLVVVKLRQLKPALREYYLIPGETPAYSADDIMMAVKYAESFAINYTRPVVFCMALGATLGDHDGSSVLSGYLNLISSRINRAVVIGGGNEGSNGGHYRSRLSAEGGSGLRTLSGSDRAELRVGANTRGFLAECWGKLPDRFRIAIRSPGGEVLPAADYRITPHIEHVFVYEKTKVTLDYFDVERNTGDFLVVLRMEEPSEGIWTLEIQGERVVISSEFDIWLTQKQFIEGEAYFLRASPETTLTVPSYAQDVLTVSTYNSENNSFYYASGQGFSRSGMIKPNVAAPGVGISAVTGRGIDGSVRLSKVTGSSMAAALAAGAVAQFFQWAVAEKNADYISGNQVVRYLENGAARDTNISYPDRQWGFGRLDIKGTFDELAGRRT